MTSTLHLNRCNNRTLPLKNTLILDNQLGTDHTARQTTVRLDFDLQRIDTSLDHPADDQLLALDLAFDDPVFPDDDRLERGDLPFQLPVNEKVAFEAQFPFESSAVGDDGGAVVGAVGRCCCVIVAIKDVHGTFFSFSKIWR